MDLGVTLDSKLKYSVHIA